MPHFTNPTLMVLYVVSQNYLKIFLTLFTLFCNVIIMLLIYEVPQTFLEIKIFSTLFSLFCNVIVMLLCYVVAHICLKIKIFFTLLTLSYFFVMWSIRHVLKLKYYLNCLHCFVMWLSCFSWNVFSDLSWTSEGFISSQWLCVS